MSSAEKMALRDTTEHDILPVPIDQQLDEVREPPRYQEVRSFLLGGPAYQWFLENVRSSALSTKRKGTILEVVTRGVDATVSTMTAPKLSYSVPKYSRLTSTWIGIFQIFEKSGV